MGLFYLPTLWSCDGVNKLKPYQEFRILQLIKSLDNLQSQESLKTIAANLQVLFMDSAGSKLLWLRTIIRAPAWPCLRGKPQQVRPDTNPRQRVVLPRAAKQLAGGSREPFILLPRPALSFLSSSLMKNLLRCPVLGQNTSSTKAHECLVWHRKELFPWLFGPLHYAPLNVWWGVGVLWRAVRKAKTEN